MSDDEIVSSTLTDLSAMIRNRTISPVDVVRATLRRIDRLGSTLNCYITVMPEEAEREAERLEQLLCDGNYLGPLHGVPISLKDNICTAGTRTTAGSPILEDWVPAQDATVVQRLRAAGAIIVAKANLYEFAFGAPHPRFGPTHNPWSLDRSCGGSSSGSAAAVAAGLCHVSIGTDTGGSIRIPATLCGIVGCKPTYGLVSRAGVIPVSYNMDHVGPMTRAVPDAAAVLQAAAGPDVRDSTIVTDPVPDYLSTIEDGVQGLRIGIMAPQPTEAIQPQVRDAVRRAYAVFEREGAALGEVVLPDLTQARTVNWVICSSEAAEYHRPSLRTRAADYHPVVRTLLEGGEFIPAADYIHAQRVRRRFTDEVRAALAGVDALLLPAVALEAYPIGQRTVTLDGHEEDVLQAITRYTSPFNITGYPALVLPCGFSTDGLPIGLQVIGKPQDDAMVFRVARAYERVTEWHKQRPAMAAKRV